MGDLTGGAFGSVALGISADGSVVVGRGTSAPGSEAFRWTADGGMIGLGDLLGGAFQSQARAASADGAVIVGSGSSSAGTEAIRWTASDGMIGLGDLLGGSFFSDAIATSADGSVIVGFGVSASGNEAFRWTASDGMVGLGDIPGSGFESIALATSEDGSVVVGFSQAISGRTAFIWTADDGMRELKGMLTDDFGIDLSGWQLVKATAISNDGRTIVGYGRHPSGSAIVVEAWIVTLPAPAPMPAVSTWGLIVMGLGTMTAGTLIFRKREEKEHRLPPIAPPSL